MPLARRQLLRRCLLLRQNRRSNLKKNLFENSTIDLRLIIKDRSDALCKKNDACITLARNLLPKVIVRALN